MGGVKCGPLSIAELASDRSERDTIRGVQIGADAVRVYIFIGKRAKRARHTQV